MANRMHFPFALLLIFLVFGSLQLQLFVFVPPAAEPSWGRRMMVNRRSSIVAALSTALLLDTRKAEAATIEPENDWLVLRRLETGVVSLPSGLMYKVLKSGPAGGASPKLEQQCEVTYVGKTSDGKQFDAGTTTFAPNQVIKGWTEAMQLMKEGDMWELYIPSRLAYGNRGSPSGKIKAGASLVFQLEINKLL
mmetsp:Transcript_18524/g.36344  ORF Transcript_18524/g.36344 Transcript_18524/m.36344 type:complete len:193 (-) Transcript_18524:116-694(-)